MSSLARARKYLETRHPEMVRDRADKAEATAAKLATRITSDASDAECWKWFHHSVHGNFPDGGGVATKESIAAAVKATEADLVALYGRALTAEEKLNLAFQANDLARKDGFNPDKDKRKDTFDSRVAKITDQEIADAFHHGDVRALRDLSALDKLKWATALVERREAKEREETKPMANTAEASKAAGEEHNAVAKLNDYWANGN